MRSTRSVVVDVVLARESSCFDADSPLLECTQMSLTFDYYLTATYCENWDNPVDLRYLFDASPLGRDWYGSCVGISIFCRPN